jgi:hypothetical protein
MMELGQTKNRAEAGNKVALEVEKEKDAAEKTTEELKRQLQPKKTLLGCSLVISTDNPSETPRPLGIQNYCNKDKCG